MKIPKQWRERPISPTCCMCVGPTVAAIAFSTDQAEWTTCCQVHWTPSATPISKLISEGCRFEGVPEWVR